MTTLGIECTAHTFGIGIIKDNKIIANEFDMYKPEKGGIVPADAAQHHRSVAQQVLENALQKANISIKDIDQIALSTGPGLPPCLVAGMEFAKSLSKPIIPVNHCIAHIEIGKQTLKFKDPLIVYSSGANTQIIAQQGNRYAIFGECIDIGIGNAIDKFARSIGLPMPGGPKIEQLALLGKKYIDLPYTVKGMDLVFSGLVTAASKKAKTEKLEDMAYSFQETIFAMLTEVTERALAHTKKTEVLLTGGVAKNRRLQTMLSEMAKLHNAQFGVPQDEYLGDNGAMISLVGSLSKNPQKDIDINPNWRTDQVELTW
ncbi:MAG: N(6)-L-threonylcarbamoyladenine synthase Kae1 [DPANN group archaeon]|nr:N(6)-L-threonylcarbamoyladenine synthase Kae1 [DPANN group archaeon]